LERGRPRVALWWMKSGPMWVRLDDSTPHHPKFIHAGSQAFGLFVAGLCFCNRFETGGLIPKAAVAHLLPGVAGCRAMKLAERLASNDPSNERPSWVDEGGYYRVHDYELYQLSSDEGRRQREREMAAERKRRQRARQHAQRVTATGDGRAADGGRVESVASATTVTITRDGHGAVTRDGHGGKRDGHDEVMGDSHARVTRDGHAPLPGPLPPSRPVLCKREFSSAHAREALARDGERDLAGEFRVWFAVYPRQEGELPALQAWLAASDPPPLPEMLSALEAQMAVHADPRYWRKAERYVRERGWRDLPVAPPPAAAGRSGRSAERRGARGGEGGTWEGR
jgi:hypothetical protein